MNTATEKTKKYKSYPEYKDSGVDWLGDVPEHWEVRKLKYISDVRPSNVDKKSIEGELPVKLCNYIDVYSNDLITSGINFMSATASQSQIKRFSLKHGDVLITKDSEAWDDIAVPAYITENLQGVLCGYHLAHISPNQKHIYGNYLFRAFSSFPIRDQFCVAANGITRFGLSKNSISSGLFLVPPLDEQQAIAEFLDRRTGEIDDLIAKKEQVIELLKEKRTAIISHAVTKGLNPDAKMKDSGIDWLGKIPEHWEVKKLKRLASIIDGDRGNEYPNESDLVDEGVPFLSSKNIVNNKFDFSDLRYINIEKFQKLRRGKMRENDLVITVRGTIGSIGHFSQRGFKTAFINAQMMILRTCENLEPKFLYYIAIGDYWCAQIDICSYGTAQQQLSNEILANIFIACPLLEEQCDIVTFLDRETSKIDVLIAKVTEAIEKLKEYRTALISAAVTGKIMIF